MLAVEEIAAPADLDDLAPEWSRLVEATPAATPFQTPEWLLPWWRNLGGGELRVLTLREAGRLGALLPLFAWGEGGGLRHLSWLGAGISDYPGMVALPGREHEAAAASLEWLAARDGWDDLDLDELRPGDALGDVPAPAILHQEIGASSVCASLLLPGDEPSFLARLPDKLRHRIPEYRRRLERAGRVEHTVASETTLERDLDALFQLHSQRWLSRAEPGVLSDPRLRAFHAAAAAGMLARGRLRLHVLWLDGSPIAAIHAFLLHGRAYSYLSGMSPAAARFSPGVVMLAAVVVTAIREGATELDMLRGDEAYKRHWRPRWWTNRRRILRRQ